MACKKISVADQYKNYNENEATIALAGKKGSGKTEFLRGMEKLFSSYSNRYKVDEDESIEKIASDDQPALYTHKANTKIHYFDLPGFNNESYAKSTSPEPDLDLFCRETKLMEYDLILYFATSHKLDQHEVKLLKKIGSMEKRFFFIRSKIDQIITIEYTTAYHTIRERCVSALQSLMAKFKEEDIFLVDNRCPPVMEWDFVKLIRAILHALPVCTVRRLTPLSAPPVDCDEMDEYANVKPLHKLCELFGNNVSTWSEAPVNIAITGANGTGKSSFINAFRGMEDNDEGAAEVSSIREGTMDPKFFSYPDNSRVLLWDLPGFGSVKTKSDADNFAERVDLPRYDCCLIFVSSRITTNAVELAKKLSSLEKPFIFVWSKFDQDVRNEKRSKGESFNENNFLNKTKEYFKEEVKELKLPKPAIGEHQVFVISSHNPTKYHFETLTKAILNVLSESKQQTLKLSLHTFYNLVIKKKTEGFRNSIKWVAGKAAFCDAGVAPDQWHDVVAEQCQEYKSQFGLDKEGRQHLDNFIECIQPIKRSNEEFSRFVRSFRRPIIFPRPNLVPICLAAFPPVIVACTSFCHAFDSLHRCVDELEKEAEQYLEKIVKKVAGQIE